MRGLVAKLETPHPFAEMLPALYRDVRTAREERLGLDSLAQRLAYAFDETLAPVLVSLDNLDRYFDPQLTPEDFLDWLASWLGLVLDEGWSVEHRRTFVAQAVELYRLRGTARGLQAQVEIFTGGTVEILETGGTAWSRTPGGSFPGSAEFGLLVRVRVDDPNSVQVGRLDALVAAARPAHVLHRVEVVKASEVRDAAEVRPR